MQYTQKTIKDFPGYKIDSNGIVWSCWDIELKKDEQSNRIISNKKIMTDKWHKISQFKDKDGYLRCVLSNKNGQKPFIMSRLMASTFIENPHNYPYVCHNNGVRTDNRLENLRWDTQKNNILDKWKHGTAQIGEKHGMHKLKNEQVRQIRKLYALAGITQEQLAQRFNVSDHTIWNVIHRFTWKHIS